MILLTISVLVPNFHYRFKNTVHGTIAVLYKPPYILCM